MSLKSVNVYTDTFLYAYIFVKYW